MGWIHGHALQLPRGLTCHERTSKLWAWRNVGKFEQLSWHADSCEMSIWDLLELLQAELRSNQGQHWRVFWDYTKWFLQSSELKMLHDCFWEVLDIVSSITAFTVGKPFSACFSTVKKVPQNRASFRHESQIPSRKFPLMVHWAILAMKAYSLHQSWCSCGLLSFSKDVEWFCFW